MKPERYNTNLAAEFWVLSALYRLGTDAHLTLGNKKAIDIVITKDSEIVFTIEVKGVADQYDWPADNIKELEKPNHVYVLICFEKTIQDPSVTPRVWVIPSPKMRDFLVQYKSRSVISRKLIKNNGTEYLNAWRYITQEGEAY